MKEGLFNLLNSRAQSVAPSLNISPFVLAPRQELFDLASVSLAALERVAVMPADAFTPTKMVSNMMGIRFDLLPLSLSTSPACLFDQQRTATPIEIDNRTIADPLTEDEEVEMLLKLKVLSGWRRKLIGDDLIHIAKGNSLSWDDSAMVSQFLGGNGVLPNSEDQPVIEKRVQEWLSTMGEDQRTTLLRLTELVTQQVRNAPAAPSKVVGEKSQGTGEVLDKLQGLHTDVRTS